MACKEIYWFYRTERSKYAAQLHIMSLSPDFEAEPQILPRYKI